MKGAGNLSNHILAGSEIPGRGKRSGVRKRLQEPRTEPPAHTIYQEPFASPQGKAACLANGASTADDKTLPYYTGRQRPGTVPAGRHQSSKTTPEASADHLSQRDPVLRGTTPMARDPEETTNTSSFSSAALVQAMLDSRV